MRLFQVLQGSTNRLKRHHVESPRLTAELLLIHCLRISRETLYANLRREITVDERRSYEELVRRRIAGEPLQYLVGHQEFWSIDLRVDPRVLIPRPETEVLVDEALSLLSGLSSQSPRVLDLGTGSGAIIIALAKGMDSIFAVATDISQGALAVAKENAERAGVGERIYFVRGDLFQPFRPLKDRGFDLILSNPPYIRRSDMEKLAKEVRDYEPRLALDGGEDGLDYFRRIIHQVSWYLREGGWLLVEIGYSQGSAISAIIEQNGGFSVPELIRDLSGIERVMKVQKLGRGDEATKGE